ncbi:hypothetical protein GCM10017567_56850 [Amycolatopsis bullii]|uniref:Uncharacterized protein n=1 Tax=Amycolatopsis bullii TaxID=941987 RepID=A0ABQ3KJS3_9PSEU|nr:hypothetical protein GCM10017567_56850 [Amycolatopsis bullii]
MVDQLDGDVRTPEPVDQPAQLGVRGGGTALGQGPADRVLTAAGQHDDVPSQLVDQLLEVVDRAAFLSTGELGVGDDPAQPVITLLLPRQDQQVRPGRVRFAGLGPGQVEGQFGAEPDPHPELPGGVVEPDRAVEAVVVGEDQRVQLQRGHGNRLAMSRSASAAKAPRVVRPRRRSCPTS